MDNNIYEENLLESATSAANMIESHCIVIVAHLAKFVYIPDKSTGHWTGSITSQLKDLVKIKNPTYWKNATEDESIMDNIEIGAKEILETDLKVSSAYDYEQAFDLFYINICRFIGVHINPYDQRFRLPSLSIFGDPKFIVSFLHQEEIWNNVSNGMKNKINELSYIH